MDDENGRSEQIAEAADTHMQCSPAREIQEADDVNLLPTGAWELPEELVMLRETVRRFMDAEVRPLEEALPHDTAGLSNELLVPLQQKARDLGLWSLSTPVEYGGAGLSLLAQAIVAEEAAKCRMGAHFPALGAFGGNPPSVLFQARPDQWERYGRPIVEGSATRPFNAVTEATGGSDPARAIQCRAVLDGDYYVLNGTKMFITHVGRAKWGIVYARTGEVGKRGGISCFIVDMDIEGVTCRPIDVMTSYSPFEINFDNARIPVTNMIGEEGQGFALADGFLVKARAIYAAGPIGIAQNALDLAVVWAKERKTFGVLLSERQTIQNMVVDCVTELSAARLLIYQAAWAADLGKDFRIEASLAKMYGTDAAFRIVDRCIQILGGMGVTHEMPLERWLRELRIKRLGEGTAEIQQMIIARSIFGK
ncbi:MAG: acyl-CoA dehydrogenase family protein [Parasphingorhabdus sp.]